MDILPKIVRKNEGVNIEALGDKHLIKLDGSNTGNCLSLIEQIYNPGQGSSMHFHQKDSHIFYVLAGVFKINLNNIESEIFEGDIVYIPNGVMHGFKVISNLPAKALVFTYPAGLENFFIELSNAEKTGKYLNIKELAAKYGVSGLKI